MFSIMTPTRGRVKQLRLMVESARSTAQEPDDLQFICYVDTDDHPTIDLCGQIGVSMVIGPRNIIHSSRWDRCLPLAIGEYLFHANDDILFGTQGWDRMIVDWFSESEDKIWMVHGDDLGCQRDRFGSHPCVHRAWVETLGYFIPPYFDGEWGDTWVNDLANRIGRRKFLPFVTEHMHRIFNKAEIDQTTLDYLERQKKQNPAQIYLDRTSERAEEAEKLRAMLYSKVSQ